MSGIDSEHILPQAQPARAEFDDYADGYTAGMENPVKRLVGRSADAFIRPKARWLVRDLGRRGPVEGDFSGIRLLDYGCGTGLMLGQLRLLGFTGELRGCDLSASMLTEAARTWNTGPRPALDPVAGDALPYAECSFDVVVLCGVLHHVRPIERGILLSRISRVLVPNGLLYVFEHNPFHPMTRYVVARTAIDRNAVLLTPAETRSHLREAGLDVLLTNYLLFFPRWRWIEGFENWLVRLPMGGQYVVVGRRASPGHAGGGSSCAQ